MIAHIEKEFQCSCGRVFHNSQSFNGHKSHCKAHYVAKYGGEVEYLQSQKIQNEHCELARIAKKHKVTQSELLKQQQLEAWIAEQHKCERCGKVMTEKFGSGRFCSRACANARDHSDETKEKIKCTLADTLLTSKKLEIKRRYCRVCGSHIKSNNKTGLCRVCLSTTSEGREAMIEIGRKTYKTRLVNGTHKGWQSRNITSYAEQFWVNVLDNYRIIYEREAPIWHGSANYFLDFKLERNGKLIDLEIDGKQHTYEDRAESDKVRDAFLESNGYIIYRVPWNEISSEHGKVLMQQKINDFIEFYNSL